MAGDLYILGQILTHTPAWVFVLLAVLILIGALAMRRRVVRPQRMLAVPAVFIVWGLVGLAQRAQASPLLAGEWVLAGAAGVLLGWSTTRLMGMRMDRAAGLVHLPGSPVLLLRILIVFVIKYALGVAIAMRPDQAAQLVAVDVAVSGLMAGYFLGWLLRFRARMRTAPEVAGSDPVLAGAAEGATSGE